jgi:hypothetical protein
LNPQGIDSLAWMPQWAGHMDQLNGRAEIGSALDDIEYLMEALDPELQEPAHQSIEMLWRRLEAPGQ